MSKPTKIIDQMYNNDHFSQWLGIERISENEGEVTLKMTIKKEMLNGFGIAHGGITYSLADSALAFASNSYGIQTVSIETSISHLKPLKEGDIIIAKSKEINKTNRIIIFDIEITNDSTNELVATFRGTGYRTGKEWKI